MCLCLIFEILIFQYKKYTSTSLDSKSKKGHLTPEQASLVSGLNVNTKIGRILGGVSVQS
jgi:hypothetical protein